MSSNKYAFKIHQKKIQKEKIQKNAYKYIYMCSLEKAAKKSMTVSRQDNFIIKILYI